MKLNKHGTKITMIMLLLFIVTAPTKLYAAPMTEEELKVLNESLSIIEIDREILRIESQQKETQKSVSALSGQLTLKNEEIKTSRDAAGKRLAAYYMGERETLLGALLSANSFHDFFVILDYYQIIAERDRYVLDTYQKEYASIRQTKNKLEKLSAELETMRKNLLEQRERVAALQHSVDGSLSASIDPEKLRAMIGEMTLYWENVGLYEVRRYFRALASAMADFPDFLQDHKSSLTSEKGGYTIIIQQSDLNDFLHSKNELLTNMSFQFDEGIITAQGSREGIDLKVEGHYTVENEPENCIVFHVDRLLFNGLDLPDTTRRELENDFDLGFYPKKIVPFVEATEAAIHQGTLKIKLKITL
ncbi:hypothetical protein D3C76_48340 [compost metagenome]